MLSTFSFIFVVDKLWLNAHIIHIFVTKAWLWLLYCKYTILRDYMRWKTETLIKINIEKWKKLPLIGDAGDWTRGLSHAKRTRYHCATSPRWICLLLLTMLNTHYNTLNNIKTWDQHISKLDVNCINCNE